MIYDIKHFQAAGILCINEGKILAVNRYNKNVWGLPFGKKEPHEDLITCAKRETFEETGLEAEILAPIYTGCVSRHDDVYPVLWEHKAGFGEEFKPLDKTPYWSTCFLANVKGQLKSSNEGTPNWIMPELLINERFSSFAKYNLMLFKHIGLI